MNGPPLEDLLRRLIETPDVFLDASDVDLAAVVSDAVRMACGEGLAAEQAAAFRSPSGGDAWRASALIGAWLVAYFDSADATTSAEQVTVESLLTFLTSTLGELSELVDPSQLVTDGERREELARLMLRDVSLLPQGETALQAQDRLETIDSVKRRRLLRQASAAEKRAEQVRRALESKRAAEAAAKASRE